MTRLFLIILALGACSALSARELDLSRLTLTDPKPQPRDAWPAFEIRRGGSEPARHDSETPKFREVGVKEIGVTWAVFYTTRSYSITDVRGLDNSWSSSWAKSFDFLGLGAQASIEYRFRPEWRMNFTPRVDIAFGIHNQPRHHTHELQVLPFTRNYLGADDQQKMSINLRFEYAVRWRYLWFVQEVQGFFAFRRTEIRAYDTDYQDDQLGTLDRIKDRDRVDWDQFITFGTGTGIGFEWFFLDEAYRIVTLMLWRPFNNVSYRGAGGMTNGLEFILRSSTFEISDQLGIYFEASFQLYLPTNREFSMIYNSQFSLGVRFR